MISVDPVAPLLSGRADSPLSTVESWTRIKDQASKMGVAPLIADIARPNLPLREQLWCDDVLTQSWVSHEISLSALKRILILLNEAGVPALALKGPVLALRYYSPPYLRKPSVDLDLAVREEDLERACAALVASGYKLAGSILDAKRFSHHVVLTHADYCPVELHFRLSHGVSGIRVDDLFSRAIRFELPRGSSALTLSPADEALHLILHLVQDRFALLFHLVELRRIWAATPLPVREEAIERGIAYGFAATLKLADAAYRACWNEPLLPESIELPKTWLHWRLNENLYRAMQKNASATVENSLTTRLRGRWFDLQVTDTPKAAFEMLRAMFWIACQNLKRSGAL